VGTHLSKKHNTNAGVFSALWCQNGATIVFVFLPPADHAPKDCIHLENKIFALVRESIEYPYMDFQKSTDINMDIHDFWMSVFKYP